MSPRRQRGEGSVFEVHGGRMPEQPPGNDAHDALVAGVFERLRRPVSVDEPDEIAARIEALTHAAEDGGAMTLTEFLLARLDEDEAFVRAPYSLIDGVALVIGGRVVDASNRMLAEVAAKRQAVRFLSDLERGDFGDAMSSSLAYSTLCRLAAVYADHPDHREEWRL